MCRRANGGPGPSAQRHFNGCHDERGKLEHGSPVSSIGKKKERGQRQRRGVRTQGRRDGHGGGDRWQVWGQRSGGKKQEEKKGERDGNWAIKSFSSPLAMDQSSLG